MPCDQGSPLQHVNLLQTPCVVSMHASSYQLVGHSLNVYVYLYFQKLHAWTFMHKVGDD